MNPDLWSCRLKEVGYTVLANDIRQYMPLKCQGESEEMEEGMGGSWE